MFCIYLLASVAQGQSFRRSRGLLYSLACGYIQIILCNDLYEREPKELRQPLFDDGCWLEYALAFALPYI